MANNEKFFYIGEGVLRGFVLSLILILMYSIAITLVPIKENITVIYILMVTLFSVMYGSIYASRKIRRRGWLVGLCVALIYVIILYIVSMVAGRESAFKLYDLYRGLLALVVGSLAGMLGINI